MHSYWYNHNLAGSLNFSFYDTVPMHRTLIFLFASLLLCCVIRHGTFPVQTLPITLFVCSQLCFQVATAVSPLSHDVDLDRLAADAWSSGWTGADVTACVSEAALAVCCVRVRIHWSFATVIVRNPKRVAHWRVAGTATLD